MIELALPQAITADVIAQGLESQSSAIHCPFGLAGYFCIGIVFTMSENMMGQITDNHQLRRNEIFGLSPRLLLPCLSDTIYRISLSNRAQDSPASSGVIDVIVGKAIKYEYRL